MADRLTDLSEAYVIMLCVASYGHPEYYAENIARFADRVQTCDNKELFLFLNGKPVELSPHNKMRLTRLLANHESRVKESRRVRRCGR